MSVEKNFRSLLVLGALITVGSNAMAYIDPGTGMSFVSGIGAFIAGMFALVFGAIAITFKKWTGAIKNLLRRKKSETDTRP